MFHLAYKKDVTISCYPDPATVECEKDYKALYPSLWYAGHAGLDCWSSWHHPIYAAEKGTVVETGKSQNGTYGWIDSGNFVAIQHPGGLVTTYKHLTDFSVTKGQTVTKGQQIGRQGTTGNSTGEHLHFDVFDGSRRIDPVPYAEGRKPLIREVTDMFDIPTTLYEYIDTPAKVRANPGLSGTDTGKRIATGDGIMVSALAYVDGYVWGKIPDGWVAIAKGTTAWAVPSGGHPDLSGKVAELEAVVDTVTKERDRARSAINAAISTLEAGIK